MSLMNYLGAVASAAVEAATAVAIQHQQQGPASASSVATSLSMSTSTASVSNRGEVVVSSAAPASSTSASDSRGGNVTVQQGLSGFQTVVPLTIQQTGPGGQQITYSLQPLSGGSAVRLAHPHVSGAGPQRTFTVHTTGPGGLQLPAHFSAPQTVEIRLPHPPLTSPVGSHLVDKPLSGVFQVTTAPPASYRAPTSSLHSPQVNARLSPMDHHHHHHHHHHDNLRLKSPPPLSTNLNNTSRPSVLMGPRSNIPHEYMSSRTDATVALQDHNYTLPKRFSPVPSAVPPSQQQQHHATSPPTYQNQVPAPILHTSKEPAQIPVNHHHHHHHSHHHHNLTPSQQQHLQHLNSRTLPSSSPPPPPIPPTQQNHKLIVPPPLQIQHPPPPPHSLYPQTTSPPILLAKGGGVGRPRSASPVSVPGRRRRKALDKNLKDVSALPERKPGVPGRKRSRKQEQMAILNNTIPPFPSSQQPISPTITTAPETVRNPLRVKSNTTATSIPEEPVVVKRKLKNKHQNQHILSSPPLGRKLKSDFDQEDLNRQKTVPDWFAKPVRQRSPSPQLPPSTLTEIATEKRNEPLPSNSNSNSSSSNNNSTTSQPSQEDTNSEGITRCICDYLHDDGFMICCDKCYVWQHVDCMGIDRKDIPEAYLCEVCNPRYVSKTRARAIQTRKKQMLELGLLEEDSNVGDSDQDVERRNSHASPEKGNSESLSRSSLGKLKRRGRPSSLSNGQPFSDSDGELHSNSGQLIHSPNSKRSRKHSGKRNSLVELESPSKIGTRKRRSVEPTKTRRSYTRRNTVTSPLSSPDDRTKDDHKENTQGGNGDFTGDGDQDERDLGDEDYRGGEEQRSDQNGHGTGMESRRKRKQIFRDIPNGDLSPPRIISSPTPNNDKSSSKPESPTNLNSNSDNKSSSSVPGSNNLNSSENSSSALHVNTGFSSYSCPYSSSPYMDKYEEAEAVCSYSPELRAKLSKNMGSSSVPDFTPLSEQVKRWKLGVTSLEGGKKLKTLLAAVRVEPGHAIIEFIGKFLMHTGFIPTHKRPGSNNQNTICPEPFVFFHQVPKNGTCICIDCRKYGNDARFVRRSCTPNAEIRHVVGKGTVHAYVVATSVIDVDEEVTIPHEFKSVTANTMNSVVQKYHVLPPPLPCACSDQDSCKAVMQDPGGNEIPHKKNGALFIPSSVSPTETKERKRRMSSRRTSSLDKDLVEQVQVKTPTLPEPQASEETLTVRPASPKVEEAPEPKDRVDGRTTRARAVATNATTATSNANPGSNPSTTANSPTVEESSAATTSAAVATTPAKRKSDPPAGRQRHRSGADSAIIAAAESATETHKMTREERKLQSVLKIIEKMESTQKKKESRQNLKKDKGGKEKKTEDRETDHDDDSQTNQTANLAPIRFAPTNKKKGRKRGRSMSKSGNNKPQMISQRNSEGGADLRSTSTESDINSADEGQRASMSPLQDNLGPNFRLPKRKEIMSEWRIGGHPSSLPSQYMRKSNTTVGAVTPPVQSSSTSCSSTPNFLSIPNGNVDNASAKKRWLRQAISEETDPNCVPSPNSRPNSPVGVECLAPLKKRRLARASMSSEVSNTPPSTPNNAEATHAELDHDQENHEESDKMEEDREPKDKPARKWSCSEVSSAEEELDDEEVDHHRNQTQTNKQDDEELSSHQEALSLSSDKESGGEGKSPTRATTPRRSRWDQVDAPEPGYSSNSNSPVKSATDAIVLDYVRNPEQYAKLTGVTTTEKNVGGGVKDRGNETCESDDHGPVENKGNGTALDNCVESSLKTPTQVKKKLSMEEYFKRKMEGKCTDEKQTAALNNSSTALTPMTNSDVNSSEVVVPKDVNVPVKNDAEPSVRGTLQFSSTPTLAERKREELGKRLSMTFGIRVADTESLPTLEKQTTPTYIASPVEIVEKQKPNGDIGNSYNRGNVTPIPSPTSVGHRLSVPTPAALKQSGMPPLPPHMSASGPAPPPPNGATKSLSNNTNATSSTSNGFVSGSSGPSSYRHHYHRNTPNGPSNFPSRGQPVSSSGPIIGGVPMANLIPPPPPPTVTQGNSGSAFGKRFSKKFFPS